MFNLIDLPVYPSRWLVVTSLASGLAIAISIAGAPLVLWAQLVLLGLCALPLRSLLRHQGIQSAPDSITHVQYLWHDGASHLILTTRKGRQVITHVHPDSRLWGAWVILLTRRPHRLVILHPGNTDVDALRRLRVALRFQPGGQDHVRASRSHHAHT